MHWKTHRAELKSHGERRLGATWEPHTGQAGLLRGQYCPLELRVSDTWEAGIRTEDRLEGGGCGSVGRARVKLCSSPQHYSNGCGGVVPVNLSAWEVDTGRPEAQTTLGHVAHPGIHEIPFQEVKRSPWGLEWQAERL